MAVVELALVGFVVLAGLLVAHFRDPIEATAVFAVFSLGLALIWVVLAAPDVALTEAAVGAGVMVFLLLITAMKTDPDSRRRPDDTRRTFRPVDGRALVVVLAVALPLGYSLRWFPTVGDPAAPAVATTDPSGRPTPYAHYVGEAAAGTSVGVDLPNAVAAVLVVYRSLDTFGEVIVAFTAVIGVLVVLGRSTITPTESERPLASRADVMGPVGRTAVRLVVALVFTFGVYLTLSGAVQPGGGFQGGVVMGSAIVLMALVFGHGRTGTWIDERLLVGVIVAGVWLFVAVAIGGRLLGGTLFEVLVYPLAPVYVVDVVEVAIGMLVGGAIAALVVGMAVGLAGRRLAGGDRS